MATITQTFVPFQGNSWLQQYAGGVQEQFGGEGLVVSGSGVITSITARSGRFRLYDSTGGASGNPLVSVDSAGAFSLAPNFTFTRGVYLKAEGRNDTITVVCNYIPA
ncbi:hypothetical protein [Paraburkholderia sp. BCC1884]|uniref:hypothetical protein n=1 Tax=Paraburkholderia sp. BCC1884 TaxID=2562668 RepID=UPI0011834411|nr:hypothetical protein [Paraburkholderia sp. BCC1884]